MYLWEELRDKGHICVHTHMWVSVHVCTRIRVCTYMCWCMYMCAGALKYMCAHVRVTMCTHVLCSVGQSCPTLCNSMDCSLTDTSVHGILQARILEWAAYPFTRGSNIAGRFFFIFSID